MIRKRKFLHNARDLALGCAAGMAAYSLIPLATATEPAPFPIQSSSVRPIGTPTQMQLTAGESTDQPKSEVQRQLELLYQQNGREMPQMPHVSPAGPGMQQSVPAQLTSHSPNRPVTQQTSGASAKKPSFFDRFKSALGVNRGPKRPPEDPGMTYPKASDEPQFSAPQSPSRSYVPPPVPGVAASPIPAVPPATPQPGLFQAPASANPIHEPASAPPATLGTPQPAKVAEAPASSVPNASGTFKPKPIPELKAILQGETETPVVEAPTRPQGEKPEASGLPTLDFQAPIERPEIAAAPAEPTEPARPPAPSQPQDPFANLFPEDGAGEMPDQEEPQLEIIAEAPRSVPEEKEIQPYTGLTLEDDLFEKAEPNPMPEVPAPPTVQIETPVIAQESRPIEGTPAIGEPTATAEHPLQPAKEKLPALTAPPSESIAEMPVPMPDEKPALDLTLPKIDLTLPEVKRPQMPITEESAADRQVAEKKSEQQSKMEKIAARKDEKGLKGFCPVVLRDNRDLVDARDEYSAVFNGEEYHFSSADAKNVFLQDPAKYAPASRGSDVIHLALTGEEAEGSLDHAVWYKGRLYLFASVETMETFTAAPSSHATNE